MEIITKYKTSPNSNVGSIVAKSGGKQKTTRIDQSKSNDWNHGTAAANFLLAKDGDDPILLAGEDWKHESSDDGQTHKFVI